MAAALTALLVLAFAAVAQADTYTVTKENDTVDGACAADNCSLRDAVIAANDNAGDDTIVLPAGHYTLSIGEDGGAGSGDLDLENNGAVTVKGAGARNTTIDAGGTADFNNDFEIDRVFEVSTTASIQDVRLIGGSTQSGADGGAILVNGNSGNERFGVSTPMALSVSNVAFDGNEARSNGGAIASYNAPLDVTNSSFTNNYAETNGSAVYASGGTTTLTNVTVHGNHADSNKGGAGTGAISQSNGTLTLNHGTVTGNDTDGFGETDAAGGLAAYGEASFTVQNSIIAGNLGISSGPSELGLEAPVENNCDGTLQSAGNNIEGVADCGFTASGDLQNTDPKLADLQDNGGPTDTRALLAGSPAIDTAGGNTPATDQRGIERPQGPGSDIGAFEVEIPKPLVQAPQPVQQQAKPGKPQLAVAGVKSACVSTGKVRVKVSVKTATGATVKSVVAKLDGKRVLSTKKGSFTLVIDAKKLKAGRHSLRIEALDSAGNKTISKKTVARCAQAKPKRQSQPRFTG